MQLTAAESCATTGKSPKKLVKYSVIYCNHKPFEKANKKIKKEIHTVLRFEGFFNLGEKKKINRFPFPIPNPLIWVILVVVTYSSIFWSLGYWNFRIFGVLTCLFSAAALFKLSCLSPEFWVHQAGSLKCSCAGWDAVSHSSPVLHPANEVRLCLFPTPLAFLASWMTTAVVMYIELTFPPQSLKHHDFFLANNGCATTVTASCICNNFCQE